MAKKRKRKNPTHGQQNPGALAIVGLVVLAVVGVGVVAVAAGVGTVKKKAKKALDEFEEAKPTPAPTPDRAKPTPRPGTLTSAQVLAHIREVLEREVAEKKAEAAFSGEPFNMEAEQAGIEMMMGMLAAGMINEPEIKAQWSCIMAATTYDEIGACMPAEEPAGGGGEMDGGDQWKMELEAAIDEERAKLIQQGKMLSANSRDGSGKSSHRSVHKIFENMSVGAGAGKKNYLGIVAVIGNAPGEGPVVQSKSFLNRQNTLQNDMDMSWDMSQFADQIAAQWS